MHKKGTVKNGLVALRHTNNPPSGDSLDWRPVTIRDDSLIGPPGPPGESIKGDAKDGADGKSLRLRGEWNRRTNYEELDVVTHQHSSWVAREANRRREPSDTSRQWQLLAARGEPGEAGETRIYHQRMASWGKLLALEEKVDALGAGTSAELPTIQYAVDVLKGQPVYIGSDGQARLAQADNAATSKVAGLAADDVAAGNVGSLCVDSVLQQDSWLDVIGSASLIPGGVLYLSASTAGQLSFVPPTAGGEFVVRVANALSTKAVEVEIAQSVLL